MEIGRLLGKGEWGFVNEVILDGRKYALKHFLIPEEDDKVKGSCCCREIEISLKLSGHPNICSVIQIVNLDISSTTSNVEDKGLLLEYCPKTLSKYLKDIRQPTRENFMMMKVIMTQLLLGLEFIHSKGIYHNDIKMDNVLIADDDDGHPTAKICDFGLSSFFPVPGCAACCYRAPEVCSLRDKFSNVSDVWSLGCVFYEMVSGKDFISLYHFDDPDPDDIIQTIIKQCNVSDFNMIRRVTGDKFSLQKSNRKGNAIERLKIRREFEDDRIRAEQFRKLLAGMLEFDPDKRLTPTSALDSEYFDEIRDIISSHREEHLYPKIKEVVSKKINIFSLHPDVRKIIKTIRSQNREWNEILKLAIGMFSRYCGGCNNQKKYFTHCVYLAHKYISVLDIFYDWKDVFPDYPWDKKVEDEIIRKSNYNIFFNDNYC